MKTKYPHKPKYRKRDEEELRQEILQAYSTGTVNLGMPLDSFRGRSIISKIDEWNDTWNGLPNFNIDSSEEMMFIFKFARAQLKNQASIINQANIRATYEAVGSDKMTSKAVSEAYRVVTEYYENIIGKKALDLNQIIKVGIEGTVFAEVSIDKETYVGDIIEEVDEETGSVTVEEVQKVIYHGPKITLHSVEDVLVQNPFQSDIQKQGWIIIRKNMTYDEFLMEYKGYAGADEVKAGEYYFGDEESKTINKQDAKDLANETEEGIVEIVRYFKKLENLYVIVANGHILYQGPMFSKKVRYPLVRVIHDIIDGSECIYGNSFMENIGSEAGLLTYLYNILIKKQLLSANPVLLTEYEEDTLDGQIEAGDIRKVEEIARTKILQFPGVDGGDSNMIGMIRESLQTNSNQAQGGGGVTGINGGVGTARQVVTAQEQAMRVIGLNATLLEECERQKKILFLDVIRDFIQTPELELILKDGELAESTKKYERSIKLKNQKLVGGKTGTVLIHFYKKSDYYNSKGEKITHKKRSFESGKIEDTGVPKTEELMVNTRNQAKKAQEQNEPMDIMYMPIEVFDEFDYDIQVVPGSSSTDSKAIEFEKRQMFIQTIAPFLGQSINAVEIASFFGEVYDYDVERFILEQQPMDPQQQAMEQAMGQFDPMEEGAILQEFTA